MATNAPSTLSSEPKPPSITQPTQSTPHSPSQQPLSSSVNAHPSKLPPHLSPRLEFWLEWILKTLGVAAAIVFGIWAPISYQATIDGNAGNDASQASVASRLNALNAQATSAAAFQSRAMGFQRSAASAVAELQTRMDAIGVLQAFAFCDGRGTLGACEDLSSRINIGDVITAAAELSATDSTSSSTPVESSTSAPPTSTTTAGTPPSSGDSTGGSRGSKTAKLSMALGIVFGFLSVAGLSAGFLMARRRRVRELATVDLDHAQ
jgi:hypothetical protein